jgi:iron-sulfur cluster insertion protein
MPSKAIRLCITAGGCNGFKKDLTIDDIALDDIVIELDSARLAIDPISAELLGAAVIDWVTGVNGSYIDIKIPSATSSCGCGDSFSL